MPFKFAVGDVSLLHVDFAREKRPLLHSLLLLPLEIQALYFACPLYGIKQCKKWCDSHHLYRCDSHHPYRCESHRFLVCLRTMFIPIGDLTFICAVKGKIKEGRFSVAYTFSK